MILFKLCSTIFCFSSNWNVNLRIVSPIEIKSGSITYSLPCEALTDRNIDNELKRLEIEITNNKIIEMYIDPENTINQYKDKID